MNTTTLLPEQLPAPQHLDPAAALAFRTPVIEHPLSADNKAATLLTLLGLMFTILGRYSATIREILLSDLWLRALMLTLLAGFALLALGTVVQAFRTISPRFPRVPPSLAFFGDIAQLTRDDYIAQVESLTADQAMDHMLRYNHTVSVIAIEKFKQLRRAIRLFDASFVCWLLLMSLITWQAMF